MARQHTNTETTTSHTDFFKVLGDLMIEHLLYSEKPKDIWVDCEVKDVTPCEECKEVRP